jgi:hypothetical protein
LDLNIDNNDSPPYKRTRGRSQATIKKEDLDTELEVKMEAEEGTAVATGMEEDESSELSEVPNDEA